MSFLEEFDTRPDEIELLATLLKNPRHAGDITDLIDPTELADPNIAELWATARGLVGQSKTADARALSAEFAGNSRRGLLDRLLAKAITGVGDATCLRERVARIREARKRENLYNLGTKIQQSVSLAHVDLEQVQERALAELADAGDGDVAGPVHISHAMGQFIEAQRSVVADRVVRTPWVNLNQTLGGGLHRQRVYVVGGATGEGKSVLGLVMAAHAAEKGIGSLIFSVEMSTVEVTGRWFARASGVDLDHIVSYNLGQAEMKAAEALVGTTDPLFIMDRPNMSAGTVHAVTRRLQRHHDIRLVVVDYLQLLEASNPKLQRHQQVGDMSRQLHLLSRELDVAVIVLAQLNREVSARQDGRPRKTDLRESGQIEQDASVVILAHLIKEQYGESVVSTGELHLIIDKNRHGRTHTVKLTEDFQHADLRG